MKIKTVQISGNILLEINKQFNESNFEGEELPGTLAVKVNLLRRIVFEQADKLKKELNEIENKRKESLNGESPVSDSQITELLNNSYTLHCAGFQITDFKTDLRLFNQNSIDLLIPFLE